MTPLFAKVNAPIAVTGVAGLVTTPLASSIFLERVIFILVVASFLPYIVNSHCVFHGVVLIAQLIAASKSVQPLVLKLAAVVSLMNKPTRLAGATRPGIDAPCV